MPWLQKLPRLPAKRFVETHSPSGTRTRPLQMLLLRPSGDGSSPPEILQAGAYGDGPETARLNLPWLSPERRVLLGWDKDEGEGRSQPDVLAAMEKRTQSTGGRLK